MSFPGNFIGNESVVHGLAQQLTNGTTVSSYFFVGPGQVGKKTLAKAFAVALAGTKNRLFFVNLLGDNDENENISIDVVRECRRSLQLLPADSTPRVVIIDGVERLSEGAANALLKLIEEPPTITYFLLIGRSVSDVPPTISSRCQISNFQLVPLDQMKKLHRPTPSSTALFHEVIYAANGRPGLAINWLGDTQAYNGYKSMVQTLVQALAAKDFNGITEVSSWLAGDATQQTIVYHALEGVVSDMIRTKYDLGTLQHTFTTHHLRTLAKITPNRLVNAGTQLSRLKNDVRAHVQPLLAIENYFLQSYL